MTTEIMVQIGQLALLFGRTNRATFHEDGVTPESDTDHTVMLGLIACPIALELGLHTGNVAQFVLVHDLVEAHAGDTNSFDIGPSAAQAKEEREAKALARLIEEFGADSWMLSWLLFYEAQEAPEARLVRYLDKAMPKITHMLNGCAAIQAMGKTHADLVRAHVEQLAALNTQYPELAETVGPLMADIMKQSEDAWIDQGTKGSDTVSVDVLST